MLLAANSRADLHWFLERCRPPRLRTMRQFAEEEVVIPDGPYAGRRFRCSRQPYSGLWFDEVDSGRWRRCVATGPTQSGKTLSCFIVPLLYHLFEVGETVICGLPHMDMAADKWRQDILPAVEQSRFARLMPKHGGGSRGGKVEAIQFLNGATLKFMSGGGGDKSRAGYTSRVVVITETDGMDQPGTTSRESDKITQLEARTRAYGSRKRIYLECTVSTEQGRTWQEYQHGTKSRIVLRCPRCRAWVGPERDSLVGWQEAQSLEQARNSGSFACPACGELWSHDDRVQANLDSKLLHEGQTIRDDGVVEGDPPATDTLGFRWSGVNNLFLSAGDMASDEWRASRLSDEENAEKEMRQFVWCLPSASSKENDTWLLTDDLIHRVGQYPRGMVPPDTKFLTAGVDLGKFLAHWILVAWSNGANGHVVDYSRIEIASHDLGVERAIMVALRQFREQALAGWPVWQATGQNHVPNVIWIDAGYQTDVVYAFCREAGRQFMPAIGRGASQQRHQWYNKPTSTGSVVKYIGEGFHINHVASAHLPLVEVNADHWKTWVHQRLSTPLDQPGAMCFFQAPPQEHLTLAKHLTAEVKTEEFIAGQGTVTRWERLRKQNHWLDCLYNASAAGSYCGVRLVEEQVQPKPPRRTLVSMRQDADSDDRPRIDMERWREMRQRWSRW